MKKAIKPDLDRINIVVNMKLLKAMLLILKKEGGSLIVKDPYSKKEILVMDFNIPKRKKKINKKK